MQLATSSCNPACQERRSITHALLRAAVPMRFVTAGCKPAKQERRTKSINVRAALTLGLRPHKSGAAPNPCFFFLRFLCEIKLSLQSCAHFAGLIFQKCSETLSLLKL